MRVHVIGSRQPGSLPVPEYIGVTGASAHDGKVLDQIRPYLHDQELYGDKAYQRPDAEAVSQAQNLTVLTPVKKQKGQDYLEPQDQWLSPPQFLAFASRLKRYLPGSKKKQVSNVSVKYVLTMV
jgi:hypothetical protein